MFFFLSCVCISSEFPLFANVCPNLPDVRNYLTLPDLKGTPLSLFQTAEPDQAALVRAV